jgi:hypothetical protein
VRKPTSEPERGGWCAVLTVLATLRTLNGFFLFVELPLE